MAVDCKHQKGRTGFSENHFSICRQHFIYKIKDNAVPTISAHKRSTPIRANTENRKQKAESCEEEIDSKFGE